MSLIKKIMTIPIVSKFMLNHYVPYTGAGIKIAKIDLSTYHIQVKMPLTRTNPNIVGVYFGGSLYSMVSPFLYVAFHASFGAQIYCLG